MKSFYLVISVLFLLGTQTAKAQYVNLHNFNDTAGSFPVATLTLAGNVLYGLTGTGGANNVGCIFTLNTDGNGFKDLHDFQASPTDCDNPWGSLTLVGGQLYGMASNGGTAGSTTDGSIFSIDTNGNNYMIRFNFGGLNIGFSPYGSLTLSDTVFYGMAGGGPFSEGVIFTIDTAGNRYDTVMTFNGITGASPHGSLTLAGNVLYGMTPDGGANNGGNIFSVHTDGTSYKNMHQFGSGSTPTGSLALLGGLLYGMTEYGGTNGYGNIFSIDTDGTGYKDRFDFNDTLGAYPQGDLTISGNLLYGMTSSGGLNGFGNVFVVDTNGTGFTTLLDFNGANGKNPEGDLVLSGGLLYGMAYGGGTDSAGVIFKLDTTTPTAINEIAPVQQGINIYPNPNTGQFRVALNNRAISNGVQLQIKIYDLLGESVYQSYITGANSQIELPNPTKGVYFYRMLTNDGNLAGEGKFVVE